MKIKTLKILSPWETLKWIWTYEPNSSYLYTVFETMKILIVIGLILSAVLYAISFKEISPYGYKEIKLFQKDESISTEDKLKLDDLVKSSLENDGVITIGEKNKIEDVYEDYRKRRLIENLLK